MTATPLDLLAAATAALRRGDVRQAADHGSSAADAFWRQGDTDGQMRSHNLLGAVAFEEGHLEAARRNFERARELAGLARDVLVEARACNNLASVAHLRGDAIEALSLYRAALLGYQRLGDRRGAGETFHNLGLVFRDLGSLVDADEATEQALRHAEAADDPQLMGLAVLGRAELELARGDADVAARAVERAGELMHLAGDAVGALEVIRLRALVALSRGDAPGAAALAMEGSARAAQLGALLLQGELDAAAAIALRRLGRVTESEVTRARAEDAFRRLGAIAHRDRLAREWGAISQG